MKIQNFQYFIAKVMTRPCKAPTGDGGASAALQFGFSLP